MRQPEDLSMGNHFFFPGWGYVGREEGKGRDKLEILGVIDNCLMVSQTHV